MGATLGGAASGLPALLGVAAGIMVYLGGLAWWAGLALTLVALGAIVAGGERLLATRPGLGRWMIEASYLVAVAVTALGTALVAVVVLNTPLSVFGDASGLRDDEIKQLSSAFAGAVSAYVALLWTKDIGDQKGALWPATRFQAAMKRAHAVLSPPPAPSSQVFDAMSSSNVRGHGDLGWGFAARGVRAGILAAYLEKGDPGAGGAAPRQPDKAPAPAPHPTA